jgi:hypothetical protein
LFFREFQPNSALANGDRLGESMRECDSVGTFVKQRQASPVFRVW